MSKRCSHNQDDLVLHFYGELEESESAVVEARITMCDGCKTAYDSLVRLENTVPRTPAVTLSDEVMESIRQSTGARVRALSETQRSSYSLIPRIQVWSAVGYGGSKCRIGVRGGPQFNWAGSIHGCLTP